MDAELKYPEWQRPLQDAFVDLQKGKLLESETAIRERLHGQSVSFDEREALIAHYILRCAVSGLSLRGRTRARLQQLPTLSVCHQPDRALPAICAPHKKSDGQFAESGPNRPVQFEKWSRHGTLSASFRLVFGAVETGYKLSQKHAHWRAGSQIGA
jgi:hypothetical protein